MDFEMPPRPTAVQLSGRGGGRGGGRGRGSSRPGGAARGGGRGRGSFGRGGSSASKFSKPKPHFKKGGAMPATITVARRVYVGNLSWRTSWQDLKDHFKVVGNVVHADVMTGNDGRSRGCGVVEFDHCNGAVAAIEQLNDSELDGRPVFVREDREDYELKAAGIVPLYGGGGGGAAAAGGGGARTVVYADVMMEPSGRSKGFGIVEFETAAEAQLAIETLSESNLDGRPLLCREDERDKEMMGQ
eukprot:gene155-32869_t